MNRRWMYLIAWSAVVAVGLTGCERLGFEAEEAPQPPEADTTVEAEPEPWENPPDGWVSPSTELLVYETSVDEPSTEPPDGAPTLKPTETTDARIVVDEDAIILENISALKVRTAAEREAMAQRADAAGLESIWQSERVDFVDGDIGQDDRDGVFKLPAVATFVDRLKQLSSEEQPTLFIALDLHPESPYSRIYSIAYSVWDEAPDATLLVRARRDEADGPIFTMVRATTRPENLGECDPTREPCARPFVEAREQGLQVRAVPGIPESASVEERGEEPPGNADAGDSASPALPCLPGQEAVREGELPRFETDRDWTSRVMLLDEALCPSVPLDDDRHDAAGLVELFNDIEAMAPGCNRASWTAGMAQPWETIGQVVGHASVQTGFDQVEFERPLPKTTPEPNCTDGVQPSAAPER